MTREIEVFGAIFMLLAILIFTIFIGLNSGNLNFDPRDEAAGNTIFLENGGNLQAAIDKAGASDAIFLNPGSYTISSTNGLVVNNKKIRILGSGAEFTNINAAGTADYVFNVVNSSLTLESLKISGAKKDGVLLDNGAQSSLILKSVTVSGNVSSGVNSAGKFESRTSLFDQNGDAIITTGSAIIENTTVRNSAKNALNIVSNDATQSKVSNSLFTNNAGTAVSIAGNSKVEIRNITAASNGSGIVETVATPVTTIVNSIVQGSKTDGITLKNANSTVTYTNSYQNTTSNYNPQSLSTSVGNLSVDSRFISSTEFQLNTSSTVRGKGSPTETNTDGSRIDLGAFGGRPILASANALPRVTSTPPEYIKPGQTYSYEIIATDPDGDALSFVVLNNNLPAWLKLEGNKLSGTPTNANVGYYGVMIVVSDRRGGNVVHPISINVIPEGRSVPPVSGTTPAPTNALPVAPKVTIVSPSASSVFSKSNNEIKWTVSGGAQVSAVEIKYSTDNQNYTTITTLPGTVTSYKWTDVEKLTSGKYFVRVEVKDNSTPPVTVGTTSEQFTVTNTPSAPTPDSITITKNNPEDNDVVSSRRQTIVVEFKPEGVELDREKTVLKVNGQNVKYDVTRSTIFYQPESDYQGSRIQVEVELVTKLGGKASKQWGFNIEGVTTPQETKPTTTTNETIFGIPRAWGLGILGFLILILLLLILYFVVRFIRSIRDQRQGNLEAEFTEYYDNTVYPQQGALATTAEQGEQAQTDLNQYYAADQNQQTPQDQSSAVAQSDQPTIVDYSQQDQGNVAQDQNAQTANTNDQVEGQEQQVAYTDQSNQLVEQPPVQEQQTYTENQQPEVTQEQPVQDYSQQPVDTNQTPNYDPNQEQMPQDQGNVAQDQNAQTANTSDQVEGQEQQVAGGGQYIDELKKKYGVTDEQINQYNQQNQGNPEPQDPNAPRQA